MTQQSASQNSDDDRKQEWRNTASLKSDYNRKPRDDTIAPPLNQIATRKPGNDVKCTSVKLDLEPKARERRNSTPTESVTQTVPVDWTWKNNKLLTYLHKTRTTRTRGRGGGRSTFPSLCGYWSRFPWVPLRSWVFAPSGKLAVGLGEGREEEAVEGDWEGGRGLDWPSLPCLDRRLDKIKQDSSC